MFAHLLARRLALPLAASLVVAAFSAAGCSSSDDGNGAGGSAGAAGSAASTDAGGDGAGGDLADAGADAALDALGDGGGAGADGGTDATLPPGTPITAPPDQWTWVDFPESKCAAGTPTGIGINPHAGADELLIYFQGGGACTDAATCWGPKPSAIYLDGYDATTFAKAGPADLPLLDRANADNSLASTNMVYVPYCTGDMHAGTAEVDMQVNGATQPTYFWGAKDLALFLARLVPTFPQVKRVYVVGASAGGYATLLDFDRVASAFGTRVDIIDDSGPPLVGQANVNPDLAVWGYEPPASCSACQSYADVLAAARTRQPSSRVGFLLFERDTTISARFKLSLDDYATKIDAFVAGLTDPNMAAYLVKNEESHVVEKDPSLAAGYLPWIAAMVSDDPGWKSETYTHP